MTGGATLAQAPGPDLALDEGALLERLERARGGIVLPFAPARLALVAGVADQILRGRIGAVAPFTTHFAFWTRAAALKALADSFARRLAPRTQARPRGLVFHLPPQNVETVFLYSWVLAYLVGNANVVRLPSTVSAEMARVCGLFLAALEAAGDTTQLFVQYPATSGLSRSICGLCDARLVWGGSAKVATFADVPLRAGGKSLWFGDRFSFAVLDGAALAGLDNGACDDLAARLYNDIYLFDQMACASPHILYVVGDRGRHFPGVEALLAALARVAAQRDYAQATGQAIAKLVAAFATAANGGADHVHWREDTVTAVVTRDGGRTEQRIGGGYLRIGFLPSLDTLPPLVREHDQTVTHFGFAPDQIADVAAAVGVRGVSRWAPVGKALDFDFIWDGYDIPFELTRLVRVD